MCSRLRAAVRPPYLDKSRNGIDLVEQGVCILAPVVGTEYWRVDRVQCPGTHGFEDLGGVCIHGGRHDEDGTGCAFHNLSCGFHAIDVGHDKVHENEVRSVMFGFRNRITSILCDPGNFMRRAGGDHVFQHQHMGFVVIYNSDSHVINPL